MKCKRRCGYTLVELLMALFGAAVATAIFFPVTSACNGRGTRSASCQSNLKQIGLAILQYAQDYHEHLPPVAINDTVVGNKSYGWADAVLPYLKSTREFHCPAENSANSENPTQNGYVDYWFDANLNARAITKLSWPTRTFLLGEGNATGEITNARYARRALPNAWLDNPESPAQRHDQAANYLFLDGHVKNYSPQLVLQVLAKEKMP